MRKIIIKGDGRTRGRQHGEELRDLIREHQQRWADVLRADLDMAVDPYLQRLLTETDFLPAIERHTPDLLEEVRGIAEGAGTPFTTTLARQLSDEEPWFRRRIKLDAMAGRGCSSIGADAGTDRATLIAQNLDMPAWCDGYQILADIEDTVSSSRALVFTLAGKLSLNGLNANGLGICCNTLSQLDYSATGLPEDFVVRGFLAQPDLQAGLSFMRGIEHASGQNYTIGAPGSRAINLEVSAGAVIEWRPRDDASFVFHTNHPMENADRAIFLAQSAGMDDAMLRNLFYGTSYPRMAALDASIGGQAGPPDIAAIMAALSDHRGPVCRHGEVDGAKDQYTLGSMVMELGDTPRLHIAAGPPCRTPFEVHDFGGASA